MSTDNHDVEGVVVWLRDVGDAEDPCWVVCAKGDPGAVEFAPADRWLSSDRSEPHD